MCWLNIKFVRKKEYLKADTGVLAFTKSFSLVFNRFFNHLWLGNMHWLHCNFVNITTSLRNCSVCLCQ